MTAVRASMSVPLSDPRPLNGGITAVILAQKSFSSKVKPLSRSAPPPPPHSVTMALAAPLCLNSPRCRRQEDR